MARNLFEMLGYDELSKMSDKDFKAYFNSIEDPELKILAQEEYAQMSVIMALEDVDEVNYSLETYVSDLNNKLDEFSPVYVVASNVPEYVSQNSGEIEMVDFAERCDFLNSQYGL